VSGIFEEITIVLLLILLNGFFSGSEAAFLAVRASRIKELAKRGSRSAKLVEKFKEHPEGFLSTVQVGVTIVGTLAAVVSGAKIVSFLIPHIKKFPLEIVSHAAEPIAIAIVVIAISFLLLVFGELVPKYMALAQPGTIAMRAARPIMIFRWLTYPALKALTFTSSGIARILGVRRAASQAPAITDEELKLMTLEGSRNGTINQTEKRLVHAALGFTHIVSRHIMTPRTELSVIDIDWEPPKILHTIVEEGYSRYPVFRGDMDKIIGILYVKDVIKRLSVGKVFAYEDLLRKPYFVPDSMQIGALLAKFQSKRTHIAIVLDEFGGTAGLITLEDILEELVGEIRDEHDEESRDFVRRSEHEAIVSGQLSIEDFNDYFRAELPTDGAGTIGGLLTERLERIPRKDDVVTLGSVILRVLRADSRRVVAVDASREVPDESE